jgi:hypothetical protein
VFRIWVGGVLAIKEVMKEVVRVRRWVDFGEEGEGMVGGWGRGEGGAEGGGFEWRGWLRDGVVKDGLSEGVSE